MSLTTAEIAFLYFKNYLASTYSLALFLKHYGTTEAKGSFPYEKVQCVEDLRHVGLLTKDDFYSSLKNKTILDSDYAAVKSAWEANQMVSLFDLLKCYSLLDVRSFLKAVLEYLKLYRKRGSIFLKCQSV